MSSSALHRVKIENLTVIYDWFERNCDVESRFIKFNTIIEVGHKFVKKNFLCNDGTISDQVLHCDYLPVFGPKELPVYDETKDSYRALRRFRRESVKEVKARKKSKK